ncbi:hypothetical protein FXW78_54005 [Rhodococcus opacus]|nr:hypothetical protein [Rhodococcus opacus]
MRASHSNSATAWSQQQISAVSSPASGVERRGGHRGGFDGLLTVHFANGRVQHASPDELLLAGRPTTGGP